MSTATIFFNTGEIHKKNVSGTIPEIQNKYGIGQAFAAINPNNIRVVEALTIE